MISLYSHDIFYLFILVDYQTGLWEKVLVASLRVTCPPNKDSDQPAHPRSLIRVFLFHMKKLCIHGFPKTPSEKSDQCENTGWSESLLGAHARRYIFWLICTDSVFDSLANLLIWTTPLVMLTLCVQTVIIDDVNHMRTDCYHWWCGYVRSDWYHW